MIDDVTVEDIKALNDTDLRELVGKLCEATLNENHIDTICVTYGGDQNESDGGVDVRVKSISKFDEDWAIPRSNTVFQVKKPSMPNSAITKEMKKENGQIKDSIKELVELNGAYIIVSSGDSLSDKRKNERVKCMKNILAMIDGGNSVKVDFYDSKRIATWVKQFPALVIWINDKLGKRTIGWKNYYNWSNTLEEEKEFIIDEEIFLHKDNFQKENQISIIDGINEIRNILSTEHKVVRLAGLSGVGKTRFAQALFDKKIGKNPLDKDKVIYCDIGNSPTPVPIAFIQELIALQKRIILVVDNCDKELHIKLAEFAGDKNSKLSLLTIEYDVKEDINVESYNYYLDTSSDNTIRKLLKGDFNYIEDANIETIVKCSDGNFRIAKYLANTIDRSESIGMLKSETIFKRLFFQDNKENEELLDTGKICSIFISFNIQYNKDEYDNEINIMSRLIDKKPINLIKNIDELNKRQIIQKRGNMRALLPHAISNKLADELLNFLPTEIIINEIKNSKRLELSLFRRLKFLHDKEYAIKICEYYLDNIEFQNISKHEIEILHCIKTIIPEEVLYKLEQIKDGKFFTRENENYYDWARILTYIAHDSKLFYRSTILLVEFVKTEREYENYNSIRDLLYKLFHIMLSGTHALIEDRLKIVDILLKDKDKIKNKIAIKLINELIETNNFVGMIIEDDNTSRKRDYGYIPKTVEEYKKWYLSIFSYCEQLIQKDIYRNEIKEILANNFRNLAAEGFYYELEKIVERVLKHETWPQIWVSIGVIKHFDLDNVPKEMIENMNILQEKCSPKTIEDKIMIFLSKGKRIYWNIDDIEENTKKVSIAVYNLGKEIGKDKKNIKENLLKIDNDCSIYRIADMVKGLYQEIQNDYELVYLLLDNISDNNYQAYIQILSDYIALLNNENKADKLLDEILDNEEYNIYYPEIQFGYQLGENDVNRVKKSLLMQVAPIERYSRIEFALFKLNIDEIIKILKFFPKSNISDNIIICILHNLYWNKRKEKKLDEYSRDFIVNLDYTDRNNINDHLNYELGEIVKGAFVDIQSSKEQVIKIYNKFTGLIKMKGISYYGYKYILNPLVELYPIEFLDSIFSIGNIEEYKIRYFVKGYGFHENIIDLIDEGILIKWIEKNKKAKEIAKLINPIEKEDDVYKWKKISMFLFENYNEDEDIRKYLIRGIYPTSWSDKYSSVLETRISLAKELEKSENEKIKQLGIELEQTLKDNIYRRQIEEEKEQERYNTFE